MEIVTTRIEISRSKLINHEYFPDEINTTQSGEKENFASIWQPAGELLVRCFSLGKNS